MAEKKENSENTQKRLSIEFMIDAIRSIRNEGIEELLNDEKLNTYYNSLFSVTLTSIKKEFLKRDLNRLLIEPVDLVHYAGLLNKMKTNNALDGINKSSLFEEEINLLLEKYHP